MSEEHESTQLLSICREENPEFTHPPFVFDVICWNWHEAIFITVYALFGALRVKTEEPNFENVEKTTSILTLFS